MNRLFTILAGWLIMATAGLAQSYQPAMLNATQENATYLYSNLKAFDALSINIAADVVLQHSDTFKVVVTTSKQAINHIDVSIDNRELRLMRKGNTTFNLKNKLLRITVYAPMIHDFQLRGSANLYVDMPIKDEDGTISASIFGSGNMHFAKIQSRNFNGTVNGSGDIDIASIVCNDKLLVNINGSGKAEIKRLAATNLLSEINGSGDIDIARLAVHSLKATVNGSGELSLIGVASEAQLKLTGSGHIDATHLKTESCHFRTNGSGKISRP